MKKLVSIVIIILFIACQCFGQEKEQPKRAFTYSVGLAYNQIWLQSSMYGADEYAVFSSPFNWGVSPFFSMQKNRWKFGFSCSYQSFSRNELFSETRFLLDKWQEASLASTVGLQILGEHSPINVTPFLGFDLCSLINYEKTVTYGTLTKHYNTKELGARNPYNFFSYYLGLGLLGGINVSCPITKHLEIGLSYCFKYKIVNNIRSDHNPITLRMSQALSDTTMPASVSRIGSIKGICKPPYSTPANRKSAGMGASAWRASRLAPTRCASPSKAARRFRTWW